MSPQPLARERLAQWIERSKLQKQEAAELLEVQPGYLSQLLNGERNPGLDTALRIEDVTGIGCRSWTLSRLSTPEKDDAPKAPKLRVLTDRKA